MLWNQSKGATQPPKSLGTIDNADSGKVVWREADSLQSAEQQRQWEIDAEHRKLDSIHFTLGTYTAIVNDLVREGSLTPGLPDFQAMPFP